MFEPLWLIYPEYQAFLNRGVGERSSRQKKASHKGLYCSLPPPRSVTSVSVRVNQSELFPVRLSCLLCIIKFRPCLLWFPRIFAQFTSKFFTQSMENVPPQCPCFLKLLTNRFLMFSVKNLLFSVVELLLELSWELLSFKISEDGKRTVCKKCARKIVNWYRMFAELREALAGGKAHGEAKDVKRSRPQTHSTASPMRWILVRD